jgi:beta-glucosidase
MKWGVKFNLPIFITENGIDDPDDLLRQKFIIEHIHRMWRAINFNWPIKGYFHWTLVDNFEWERGWSLRFGLWELDRKTQERKKRKSAALYQEICKENALTSDMIYDYAPELAVSILPG